MSARPGSATRTRRRCPWCSCRCPSRRTGRTGCTWTWPPNRPRTRRPRWSGCSPWVRCPPTSGRATCPGPCWPTRRATSSACSTRGRPTETPALSRRSPDGLGPYLELLPSADPKAVKNRIHLDVAPYQDEDHAAAILALTEAGAVSVDIGQGAQGDVPWTVLADPEGSEFCVLSPR